MQVLKLQGPTGRDIGITIRPQNASGRAVPESPQLKAGLYLFNFISFSRICLSYMTVFTSTSPSPDIPVCLSLCSSVCKPASLLGCLSLSFTLFNSLVFLSFWLSSFFISPLRGCVNPGLWLLFRGWFSLLSLNPFSLPSQQLHQAGVIDPLQEMVYLSFSKSF